MLDGIPQLRDTEKYFHNDKIHLWITLLPGYFIPFFFSFMGMMVKLRRAGWEMSMPSVNSLFFPTFLLVTIRKCFPVHRSTVSLVLVFLDSSLQRELWEVLFPTFGGIPGNAHLRDEHCFKTHSAYLWTLELCRIGARELSFLQTGILRHFRLWPHLFLCHLLVHNPGALKFRLSFRKQEYILHLIL